MDYETLKLLIQKDQVDKFIRKMTKVYKALRVLETNKQKETPYVSKSLDKMIRYFSKSLPEEIGSDKTLNDIAFEKKDQPYTDKLSDLESLKSTISMCEIPFGSENSREQELIKSGSGHCSTPKISDYSEPKSTGLTSSSQNVDLGHKSQRNFMHAIREEP